MLVIHMVLVATIPMALLSLLSVIKFQFSGNVRWGQVISCHCAKWKMEIKDVCYGQLIRRFRLIEL